MECPHPKIPFSTHFTRPKITSLLSKIDMEPQNSTTSTYTAPTCTLKVNHKPRPLSHLERQNSVVVSDFELQIDHPDRGELERTTLQGNFQVLDRLQLAVSDYIAEAIAKFPLPTTASDPAASPEPPAPQIDPPAPSAPIDFITPTLPPQPPSGLMQNLPGLRRKPPAAPSTPPTDANNYKSTGSRSPRDASPRSTANRSEPTNTPNTPYLTGGNGSLDHQLHLGELATPAAGAVQVLSAIQLFDLATVLDEYAATKVNIPNQGGTKVHAQSLAAGGVKRADVESTAASLSRLPNLPRIPAELEPNPPAYYRTRRSRSGLMSALPWAAAAALLVGAPLLVFGTGSIPLKDLLGKVKLPSFLSSDSTQPKKPVVARPTMGTQTDKTAIETTPSTTPRAALPKPWQAQSVNPPKTPPTTAAGTQNGQPATSNIGIATLPSGIAPNPLISGLDPAPNASSTTNPTVAATATTPTTTAAPTKPTPTRTSKAPAKKNNANVSLSTQPILMPQDAPGSGGAIPPKQVAIPPQTTAPGGGIDAPTNSAPTSPLIDPLVRKQPTKKTSASQPKPQASSPTVPFLTPSPTIEPKIYQPNPNLITPQPSSPTANNTPIPPNNVTGNETPTPQVFPDRPFQANNGQGIEDASLQDAKRYFQGKWKATPTQQTTLQYVLDVNGKNGVVRSVNPQGEAATNYLKQTKLIKPGQKIVTPVAGSSDRKIRILLQPDGNVDTFLEP